MVVLSLGLLLTITDATDALATCAIVKFSIYQDNLTYN